MFCGGHSSVPHLKGRVADELIKFRSRFSIALILTTEVVPLPDTEEFGPELDRLFHLACEK